MTRSAPGRSRALPVFAWVALLAPSALSGQDIQAVAEMRGLTLPPGYYAQLAADPTSYTLPNGLFRIGPDGERLVQRVDGTKRVAVIPALFADSPEPHVTAGTIQERIFDGPAPRGTLTALYQEMSGGRLNVTGEVNDWVRTSLTRAEVVGTSNGLVREDARTGEFLLDALRQADPGFDFGLYDNDGPDGLPNSGDDDGWVDAIAFEFIEIAASCGGPGIWPHLWGIRPWNAGQPFTTDDARPDSGFVQIDAYIIQSAVDCGGTEPQDAAVIAHEFGHVLGLPDYYHPTVPSEGSFGRRWVLGCWELMAAGAWGCDEHNLDRAPFGPTHMSARSKNRMDWLTYRDVGAVRDAEFVLAPVQTSEEALRIPLDDEGLEFLLLEYRQQTGFDDEIPADGVVIYHQDFQGSLRPDPEGTQPYFLRVVERDDNAGLVRNALDGGNRGEAGDAWGVGGVDQKLHGMSVPSSRRNDGSPSSVTIHSLVVEGGVAKLRISTAATPEIVAPTEPLRVQPAEPFEQRLRVGGGFMPYAFQGSGPEGVSLTVDGDDVVVAGTLGATGPFELALGVVDALGRAATPLFLPITAGEWLVGEDRLLQSFLGSSAAPLEPAERSYLDFVGNGNGRYDVGDLRAWLRDNGG
jgi:M6 family metalloprotease-like protein